MFPDRSRYRVLIIFLSVVENRLPSHHDDRSDGTAIRLPTIRGHQTDPKIAGGLVRRQQSDVHLRKSQGTRALKIITEGQNKKKKEDF